MIELSVNGFWRARYTEMLEPAERAARAATALGDAPLTAAALAVRALAESMAGMPEAAEPDHMQAAALIDSLSDDEVAERLDSLAWIAGMELYADRYREADAHAARALAIARATGQGDLFLVLVQELGRVWFVRGKLAEAADLLDGGTEAARLLGNTHALVWNLFNRSFVALATGDVPLALATARESVELSHGLDEGFHSAWAAVRLADVLLETRQPQRATELLLGAAGGEGLVRIPGSWRAYCLELLTRSRLALDLDAEARNSAAAAESWASTLQLPLAAAWATRASAAVKLHTGEEAAAAELALASTAAAAEAGAPIEAARSRILAGRALARLDEPQRAIAELEHAAADLETCGALRYRDEAEHELGKLGHRTHRRTRAGKSAGTPVETLTERELQLARLVVERKTNAQIAAELFLSKKTVETHLRNIFRKVGVSTRAELAGAVQHADNGAPTAPRP
jgi:DNA-binding CsgD family transcriptional regulator